MRAHGSPIDAEALLDLGHQLPRDRVAVRTEVHGVHAVAVVEVRIRVLQRDDDHPREVVADPRLVQLARLPGTRAAAASEKWPWRYRIGYLTVDVVIVAREKHGGAEVDRPAPELREQRALDLDPLHPLGVGGDLHRRDRLIGDQLDRLGRRADVTRCGRL